jgi:hypothetical protein
MTITFLDSFQWGSSETFDVMTRKIKEKDAYEHYSGKRVRIVWNPQTDMWFVYLIEAGKHAKFCIERLELHTVGVFGDIKPPFAPKGSPSFVGTIAAYSILTHKAKAITSNHRFAPSMLFVGPVSSGNKFTYGERVLVDGPKMFCKL